MTPERPDDTTEISAADEAWVRSRLHGAVVDVRPSDDLITRAQETTTRASGSAVRPWLLRAAAVAALVVGAAVIFQMTKEPTTVVTNPSSTTEAPPPLPNGRTLEVTGVTRLGDGRVDVTLTLTAEARGTYLVRAIYGSMQDPDNSAPIATEQVDGEAGEPIQVHLVFVEPSSLSVPPELGTSDPMIPYVAYSVSEGAAVTDLAMGRLPDTTGLPVAEATSLLRLYQQSVSTIAGACDPGIVCEVTTLSSAPEPFAAVDGRVTLTVGV